MKHILLSFLLIVFFAGCEPGYRIYVRNSSSSDLYIKTLPSIESLYDSHSTYYDSIVTYKIKQEGNYSIYKVKPYSTMLVWGTIGGSPTVKELPFDYIALISGSDTTVLNSKEKIIEQAKQVNRKRNFYIEVRKRVDKFN
jgi:hypothetical protein